MSLNNLGLAIKAKKVVFGTEFVIEAVRRNKVCLVLVANDASEKTLKKVLDKCQFYQVAVSKKFSSLEFAKILNGKNVKVIGITDQGFKKLVE